MSSDDDPPSPFSRPSTSTCTLTCDATCDFTSISISTIILSLDFDKLSLDPELLEGRYQKNSPPGPQSPTRVTNMPPTDKKPDFYRTPTHRSGRFQPYEVPFNLRRRRKRTNSSSSKLTDMDVLRKIKLKGDVEALRMCIFDKDKVPTTPCSVQAARPPSPTESEEVDELSEYFTHFVRVELKMSSLAESMYV